VQQGKDPAGVVRAPNGRCFPLVPYCGPVPVGKPWKAFNRDLEAEVYGQPDEAVAGTRGGEPE